MKKLTEIYDSIIDEDYPTTFNMESFKQIQSFNGRIKYCEEQLTRISSGSGRVVYKIDNEKVLKLSKNKKGVAQTDVEIEYGNEHALEDIVATVFDSHPNGLWVEMELARKLTAGDFLQITGYKFNIFSNGVLKYGVVKRGGEDIIVVIDYGLTHDVYDSYYS